MKRASDKGKRNRESHNKITTKEICPEQFIESVRDSGAGAIVLFLGTVRDDGETTGRVEGMHYEAYVAMAEEQMKEIEDETSKRWPIRKIKTIHRVGELETGDISVAVCVSSAHRTEAFEACQYALEVIKAKVPVWKKEILTGGANIWVSGTPQDTLLHDE